MTQINPDANQGAQTQQPQTQANPQDVAREILNMPTATGASIDPATLQMLMTMMIPVVSEMGRVIAMEIRKPTPEEQEKLRAEKERQKSRSLQAAKAGEMEAAMIKHQQDGCPHLKPNGEHTFRGQVHANGWAEIKCQRCLVKFVVRPLPEQIQNGLNLGEIRGLTIEHLRSWQANSAEIDRKIRASQDAMYGMAGQFHGMAPQAPQSQTGL